MADETKPLTDEQIETQVQKEWDEGSDKSQNKTAGDDTADQDKDIDPNPDKTSDGDDPSKKGKDASETDEDEKEADKKKSRVEKLLEDRNEARTDAAKAKQGNQQKDDTIKDLQSQIDELKANKQGDDKGEKPEKSTADNTKKTIKEMVDDSVNDKMTEREKVDAAEKADIADVAEIIKEHPEAEEWKDDIINAMKKHKTLSAYGAYTMLKGAQDSDKADDSSDSNKLKTGDRSKQNLRKGKDVSSMKTEDLENYLQKEQASGRLII